MITVLAGDWHKDGGVVIRRSLFGKPKALWMPTSTFRHESIPVTQVGSVELVTEDNKASVLGKAAWGAAGGLLLGPLGLVVGALAGGNKRVRLASIVFKDGRKALVQCKPDELKVLLSIAY
jgi:uncharacterized membrane protein